MRLLLFKALLRLLANWNLLDAIGQSSWAVLGAQIVFGQRRHVSVYRIIWLLFSTFIMRSALIAWLDRSWIIIIALFVSVFCLFHCLAALEYFKPGMYFGKCAKSRSPFLQNIRSRADPSRIVRSWAAVVRWLGTRESERNNPESSKDFSSFLNAEKWRANLPLEVNAQLLFIKRSLIKTKQRRIVGFFFVPLFSTRAPTYQKQMNKKYF